MITAIAANPRDPTIVFAGSWVSGVYKSTDGGVRWQRSSQGLGNLKVVSLAIDPATSAIVYAGTYKGKIYKSSDNGATWRFASDGIQQDAIVYSIVIDPLNTQRIYAATRGTSNNGDRPWAGVVYRSEDGGASWAPALYDLGGAAYQDWAYALEINPSAPQVIFAATHEHGPVRSDDYGRIWRVLENGISNHSTRAIVVDPRPGNAGTVYTGVWTRDGVFKSYNGGESWEQKSRGLEGAQVYRLGINPFFPNTLFAGTYNMGVMRTTNGANSWSTSGLNWVGIAALQVSPTDGQILFAGTDGDGLYKSVDGGQSWSHSQDGLAANPVTSLAVSPGDPSTYYAGLIGGGVMHSQDGGQTWSAFNQGLADRVIHALVKHPVEDLLFALTDNAGLYRCNLASGACWEQTGLDAPANEIDAQASDPSWLAGLGGSFLPMIDPTAAGEALAARDSAPLLTLAFAPSNPGIAYLGTYGAGVQKSVDGGNSWAPTQWSTQQVWSIAIHPNNPEVVYATSGAPETIGTSRDGGNSWQELNLPGLIVYALAIPPARPNVLVAGTDDGIYRYSNGSWIRLGLAGKTVTALSIHPQKPELFVAGTLDGAWFSTDAGGTWLPGPAELQGIPVNSISFSPHNPELIFYNTPVNGTLRVGYD